ncbi:HAD family phosphatase [Hyunsoonleella sp. SJ7]|uniref:HAD family phosphatase n=1 Tax=Hyunsoonleella aquatilis TaxID=2762758 RepID=A0A923H868_9FLAO|nr:HAD family hydrolase [Hyunsoonleella aquatilis]MBC3757833.1 HAD family phosphatase [Hyunsoonleella aquatilis]
MNLSQVKLIVSDMDGTLLNSKHEVSRRFLQQFNILNAAGVLFVAASGRPFYGITDKLSEIQDHIIIVAENGGLVVKNGTILSSNPLRPQNFDLIVETISSIEDAHPVFCTKNQAYVMSKSQPLLNLLSEYYAKHTLINSVADIKTEVYKVALFHENSSSEFIYPHVKHLESDFKVKLSATHWVDISENIANKGYAIELIQDQFGINPEETLAFGDYNNDLEMLENAYFSYAMENAHPKVKSTARFKTKSNNEFGVEVILEQLIKEKNLCSKRMNQT